MYVCICNGVTEREIRQAVTLGVTTLHELRDGLGVASNCGKCDGCARDVLREALAGAQCHALAQAA